MLTLNQIKRKLEQLREAHPQLKAFYFGDPWEIKPSIRYPLMVAALQPGALSLRNNSTKLMLIFADRVNPDESNEAEVLSDTQLYALDIYAQLFEYFSDNGIELSRDAPFSSFTEAWDDMVSGWQMEITINQFYSRDTCQVPNIIPIPPPPYIVAFRINTVLEEVSAPGYDQGDGPGAESETFQILAEGLFPDAGNATVTPGTSIEVWNGTAWTGSPFTIPYTSGTLTTSQVYKVRLKAGLVEGNIDDTLTLSAANAQDFIMSVTGTISPPTYDVDAIAFFTRAEEIGPAPSLQFKSDYNQLVLDLKGIGEIGAINNFQYIDWCRIYGGVEYQPHASINIVNPTGLLSIEVNSPSWSTGGYTGDGATSYIRNRFFPSVDGVNFQMDSACLYSYTRTNIAGAYVDIGCRNSNFWLSVNFPKFTDDKFYFYVNNTPALDASVVVADALGSFASVRTDGNTIKGYKNGVEISSGAVPSSGLPSSEMFTGANNNDGVATAFSPRQNAASLSGSGLLNQAKLHEAFQNFFTRRGIAV